MQAVGQLDQDDADVVDHSQEHLAQVFGLDRALAGGLVAVAGPRDLTQLRHTVDQEGDPIAELRPHGIEADRAVLDDVVQKRGNDRLGVDGHAG